MKFDIKTWLILGLLVVIVLLILFQPSKPDKQDTRKYDSLIRVAQAGEAKAKELAELRKADSLRSVESKKEYEVKVKKLEGRISDLKANPVIVKIREEVKEVDDLIIAYDSANRVKDDRIAELSGELYDCQKMASNAEENFQATLQAQHGANAELVEDNQELKKDLRKERRKGRGWKALAVVGTVLGFIGGSQL